MSKNLATQVAEWSQCLDGPSVDDQLAALRQICSQDSVQGVAVQVVELSGSPSDELRTWAAEALESSILATIDDIAALTTLLDQSDDGEICYWTATLLGRLGKHAAPAAESLASCLRSSMYLPARERASWALAQIGPDAAVAIPALKDAADGAPPRLQRLATQAIDSISGSGDSAEVAA